MNAQYVFGEGGWAGGMFFACRKSSFRVNIVFSVYWSGETKERSVCFAEVAVWTNASLSVFRQSVQSVAL